jgi:hypothetical protein
VKVAILALAVVVVVVVGCGSNADALTSASSNQPVDGGAKTAPDAGINPPSDAGVSPTSKWVRDSTITVYGDATVLFHSPQPGDLWLERRFPRAATQDRMIPLV